MSKALLVENQTNVYQFPVGKVKSNYHQLLAACVKLVTMNDIHQRLRDARIAAGFPSAAAAAQAMGLPYQTYAGHENGKAGIRTPQAERYARKFRISLDWLVTGRGEMRAANDVTITYKDAFGLPVIGKIRAGYWLDASVQDQDDEGARRVPMLPDERYQGRQYALQVEGDSLNKIVDDGAFVTCVDFAESGMALASGLIAHVERRMNGGQLVEVTLKRVERTAKGWRLVPQSTNPKWQPIEFGGNDDDAEVVIRGIVLGTYRPLI